MCEYHLRLLYMLEEFGEISNIDSFAGSDSQSITILMKNFRGRINLL